MFGKIYPSTYDPVEETIGVRPTREGYQRTSWVIYEDALALALKKLGFQVQYYDRGLGKLEIIEKKISEYPIEYDENDFVKQLVYVKVKRIK